MTQSETLIVILLLVIAFFLYQIARQLTFLTGKKFKLPFSSFNMPKRSPKSPPKSEEEENLLN